MSQPVVLITEELSPATLDALGPDFEVRHCNGADRSELLPALADVDAVLVRSATVIDAEALGAARRLKVVARAGVGLDNVDVAAATSAGVMVVNAPTSNIVSAAEMAVALLLAAARNIAPANAALRRGEWKRSEYTGVEVYGKVVGVVGLGRIGVLAAQRLMAFGTKVIAYDPYVQPGRAAQLGIQLVDLETLLADSDFITIHLPRTPETLGLIGREELRLVKPSVIVVNAARGGIVDEAALAEAVSDGRVLAAGVDVFDEEPCTSSPLFEDDRIVATALQASARSKRCWHGGALRLAVGGKLNLAGVEFNAVGNHEFDKGSAELLRMQYGGCEKHTSRTPCAVEPFTGAGFNFLAANVLTAAGGTLFSGTALKNFGPVQIGFIGMTLKETATLVTPAGVAGLTFADEAADRQCRDPDAQGGGGRRDRASDPPGRAHDRRL